MQPRQPGLPKLPVGLMYALVVVCAVGLASLAHATLIRPLTSWRHDVNRRVELVRAKLAQGPEVRRQHAEREQELAELLARVEEVNHRIPDQPREGEFLADLTRLAGEHGLVIEDFRRGDTTDSETYSVVTVAITARGSYRAVCGFVEGVSKLPRLAELTQLSLRTNRVEENYPVSMTYALYYGLVTAVDQVSTAKQ